MKRKSNLRLLRFYLKQLSSSGALEPGQKEAVERAIKKIQRGSRKRDIRLIEEGVGCLCRVFLK
jgi:hypothetical protein